MTEAYKTVILILQDICIPWHEKVDRIQAIAHATGDEAIREVLCDITREPSRSDTRKE